MWCSTCLTISVRWRLSKKELTSQRGGHQNLQFFSAGDFPFFSCQTVASFDDAVDDDKSKCEIGRFYGDESAMPQVSSTTELIFSE